MNDLKVTLYDVFGYLIPGTFFAVAVGLVLWGVFYRDIPLHFHDVPVAIWWIGALVAYVMGHVVQAIANILGPVFPRAERSCIGDISKIPSEALSAAKAKAEPLLGLPASQITDDLLAKLCQHSLPQQENQAYELFAYHQGFYRGLVIAFAALGLALSIRGFMPLLAIRFSDQTVLFSRAFVFTMAAINFICMYLSHRRYRRFAEYRVLQMFFAFLLRETQPKRRE